MTKALTRECSSCILLKVTEDNEFLCRWGKSKKKKKLVEKRGMKECKLMSTLDKRRKWEREL